MENSAVSLKITHIFSINSETPANNRYFIFSKQFDRAQLAEGFAQKVPSQIVTALNVTKIAPALFFMIEKFAFALEAVLNRAASLLGCAAGVLDAREVVVADTSGKAEETPPAIIEEKPVTPVKDETKVIKEPVSPIKEEATSPAVVEEKPATPVKDETTVVQPQAEAPKEDGLDKCNDSLIEPKVPPTPSNITRNLVYGAGLGALILGTAYIASRYLGANPIDPRTLNPGNGTCFRIPYRTAGDFETSQPACHPDSGELCGLVEPLRKEDIATCHIDDTQTCWSTTRLLNGEIARMTTEEREARDNWLTSHAYNSSAFEFDENTELCWVKKSDSKNMAWGQLAPCEDAPGNTNAPWCFDEKNNNQMYADGSPFTALKEKSNGNCIEVTCNELFACDNDSVCEE